MYERIIDKELPPISFEQGLAVALQAADEKPTYLELHWNSDDTLASIQTCTATKWALLTRSASPAPQVTEYTLRSPITGECRVLGKGEFATSGNQGQTRIWYVPETEIVFQGKARDRYAVLTDFIHHAKGPENIAAVIRTVTTEEPLYNMRSGVAKSIYEKLLSLALSTPNAMADIKTLLENSDVVHATYADKFRTRLEHAIVRKLESESLTTLPNDSATADTVATNLAHAFETTYGFHGSVFGSACKLPFFRTLLHERLSTGRGTEVLLSCDKSPQEMMNLVATAIIGDHNHPSPLYPLDRQGRIRTTPHITLPLGNRQKAITPSIAERLRNETNGLGETSTAFALLQFLTEARNHTVITLEQKKQDRMHAEIIDMLAQAAARQRLGEAALEPTTNPTYHMVG